MYLHTVSILIVFTSLLVRRPATYGAMTPEILAEKFATPINTPEINSHFSRPSYIL